MIAIPELAPSMLDAYPRAVIVGLVLGGLALVLAILPVRAHALRGAFGRVAAFAGLATLAALFVLAATAFTATLASQALHGWALLAHVSAGAVFAVGLALTALLTVRAVLAGGKHRALAKLTKFTLSAALLCSTIAAASILLCTFPVAGTTQLAQLLDVHRWTGLCAFVLALATTGAIVRDRRAAAASIGAD